MAYKLTINTGFEIVDLYLGERKYLVGGNYLLKYRLAQSLKRHLSGVGSTEYSNELGITSDIKVNDLSIDRRTWDYYEVTQYYDLNQDLKMGAKSLVLKYIDSCLDNIEYNDLVKTIDVLMKQLTDEVIDEKSRLDGESFSLLSSLADFNQKMILKMIEVSLQKDGCDANQFDLSYEELIVIQLLMLQRVYSDRSDHHKAIIVLDIPFASKSLINKLTLMRNPNVTVLCFLPKFNQSVYFTEVLVTGKYTIDLADDVSLYNDIILNLPVSLSLEELKRALHLHFLGEKADNSEPFLALFGD